MSRDILVSKLLGSELDCLGSIPVRGRHFYLRHNVQTGVEAQPASDSVGGKDSSPKG
jgi:hypothetical protein